MITLVSALGILAAVLVTALLALAGFALAAMMVEESVPPTRGDAKKTSGEKA